MRFTLASMFRKQVRVKSGYRDCPAAGRAWRRSEGRGADRAVLFLIGALLFTFRYSAALAQLTPAPELQPDILGIDTIPPATNTAEPLPRAASFEVTIRTEAAPGKTPLQPGMEFPFRVILSWDAADTAVLPEIPQYDPPDNLEIVSVASTSRTETAAGRPRSSMIHTFTLRPVKPGHARMSQVRVDYRLQGDPTVRTLRTLGQDFTVGEPPRELLSTRDWILIIGVLILVSAGAGILLLILRLRRKPASEPRIRFSDETAQEVDAIRQKRLEGDHRAFCSGVASLIRKARKRASGLDEEKARQAENVLSACEERKFAPTAPRPVEMDKYLETALELIQWVDAKEEMK